MIRFTIKVKFTAPLLGAAPMDEDAYEKYILPRIAERLDMPGEEKDAGSEMKLVKNALGMKVLDAETGEELRAVTGFLRDSDGAPVLSSHVLKGLFKEACSVLRKLPESESKKITAFKKVIDGMIFPCGELFKLNFPAGETEMKINTRSLRANTAQGERIALASSEEMPKGTTCEMAFRCLDPKLEKAVREWLDYGGLKGLGQWRNAGYGQFEWEEVEVVKTDTLL